jgi:release factor glutamine methyltransferase
MPKTYNELYIDLRRRLRDAGVEADTLEAALLVAHAAGKSYAKLMADLRLYSSPEIEARVEALARRRLAGEPAAYITGSWSFCGLELAVSPDVLIPRSDTEILVETALNLSGKSDSELRILDLCTGSGCVGIALAHFLPRSRVVLADVSAAALRVARENVQRCGCGARAMCVEADALTLPSAYLGSFDLIVSNPPYIPNAEIASLDASVREYEPRLALDGGDDGLRFYRAILGGWKSLLRQSGWMLFEVGETQAQEVEKLMRLAGLRSLGRARDSAGYDRVVFGRL